MAQMGIAAGGASFDADHAVRAILLFDHSLGIESFGETGPTGAGIELVEGTEKRFAANEIDVDAWGMVIPEFVAERGFGSVFTGHFVLDRCHFLFEFRVGFVDGKFSILWR